jgi:hypothetical protein
MLSRRERVICGIHPRYNAHQKPFAVTVLRNLWQCLAVGLISTALARSSPPPNPIFTFPWTPKSNQDLLRAAFASSGRLRQRSQQTARTILPPSELVRNADGWVVKRWFSSGLFLADCSSFLTAIHAAMRKAEASPKPTTQKKIFFREGAGGRAADNWLKNFRELKGAGMMRRRLARGLVDRFFDQMMDSDSRRSLS